MLEVEVVLIFLIFIYFFLLFKSLFQLIFGGVQYLLINDGKE